MTHTDTHMPNKCRIIRQINRITEKQKKKKKKKATPLNTTPSSHCALCIPLELTVERLNENCSSKEYYNNSHLV